MKIRYIFLRTIQGIIAATLIFVLAMAIIGMPRPPSITTRHAHRLAWKSAIDFAGTIRELGGVLRSDGWPASDMELMIGRGSGRGGRRVVLSNPNEPGRPVADIPVQVRVLVASPDATHPLVAYLLDEGGSSVIVFSPGAPALNLLPLPIPPNVSGYAASITRAPSSPSRAITRKMHFPTS